MSTTADCRNGKYTHPECNVGPEFTGQAGTCADRAGGREEGRFGRGCNRCPCEP